MQDYFYYPGVPLLLHPPKTGGTTLRNAIIQTHGEVSASWKQLHDNWKHQVYEDQPHGNQPAALLVRNPYSRAISMYHYLRFASNHRWPVDQQTKHNMNNLSFEQFLKAVARNKVFPDTSTYKPCTHWWHPNVQWLIKFESYAQDVKAVYNINIDQFEYINKTQEHLDSQQLTPMCVGIINTLYQSDFEKFGYTQVNSVEELKRVLLNSTH